MYNQLISTDLMFNFCVENFSGIKFFKVLDEDVISNELALAPRFELAQTIDGSQQFHRFVPVSESQLQAYKMSNQKDKPKLLSVTDNVLEDTNNFEVSVNDYVCCQYENDLYIGLVKESSEEHGDFFIQFMTPKCPSKQYFWPKTEDTCWVLKENIKALIGTPSLTSSSSRGYTILHFLFNIYVKSFFFSIYSTWISIAVLFISCQLCLIVKEDN